VRTTKSKKTSSYEPSRQRQAKVREYLAQLPGGIPRPEYPRPQFVRREWLCLNGKWDFTFDDYNQGLQGRWWDMEFPDFIVVPFAPQTELSCKNEKDIFEIAWYAREFEVPESWRKGNQNILLHFGAVDYRTTVWVNGEEVGHNQGGHVPFNFDIAPYVKKGKNRVVLRVEDPQDPYQPRGKQAIRGVPKGCDYYCTTGIWQTVWIEPVPAVRIQDLYVTPVVGEENTPDAFEIRVYLHAPATGWNLEVEVLDGETVVAHAHKDAVGATARFWLPIPDAKLWSPENPHLYDLRVRLSKAGEVLDEVSSYAGLRSVKLRDGQLCLNGEQVYLKMVLDQGYWPESYLTAPTDEALKADVEWCKKFGFNGARKHQKVEDPRWLYWCDKLGLVVWGEMANARAWSPKAEEWFMAEWERAVRRDYNHPCIITWVPINESWGVPGLSQDHPGQYAFLERIVALTRRLDPDRPVIDNDGWEHTGISDIIAIHDYTPTAAKLLKRYEKTLQTGELPIRSWGKYGPNIFVRGASYSGQPVMLTEVGGFLMHPPDLPKDKWDPLYEAYGTCRTPEDMLEKYRDLMQGIAALPFVSGFCYTQLTDIEVEINGLLTYDRQPKVEPEQIAAIHQECFDKKPEKS